VGVDVSVQGAGKGAQSSGGDGLVSNGLEPINARAHRSLKAGSQQAGRKENMDDSSLHMARSLSI